MHLRILVIAISIMFPLTGLFSQEKQVYIFNVTATSVLENSKKYTPEKLFDGKMDTAWVEGKKDDGLQEVLYIDLSDQVRLKSFTIYNGLQAGKYFNMNNRVKELDVWLGVWDFKLRDNVNYLSKQTVMLEDMTGPQVVKLPENIQFSKLRLEIKSVYKGTRWQDTCISEINISNAILRNDHRAWWNGDFGGFRMFREGPSLFLEENSARKSYTIHFDRKENLFYGTGEDDSLEGPYKYKMKIRFMAADLVKMWIIWPARFNINDKVDYYNVKRKPEFKP